MTSSSPTLVLDYLSNDGPIQRPFFGQMRAPQGRLYSYRTRLDYRHRLQEQKRQAVRESSKLAERAGQGTGRYMSKHTAMGRSTVTSAALEADATIVVMLSASVVTAVVAMLLALAATTIMAIMLMLAAGPALAKDRSSVSDQTATDRRASCCLAGRIGSRYSSG